MAGYLLHLLPSELMIEILNRLPLETLVRCTSVCKSWYSLITSPSYVAIHLNHNNNNGSSRLLVTRYTETREKIISSVHHDNESFIECAKLEFPITLTDSHVQIVGSVNGLVLCLLTERYGTFICLWNPSIKKCLILRGTTLNLHGKCRDFIGFGFDPSTNDYKIVRVFYRIKGFVFKFPPEVEVYELSTRSWRSISAGDFSYFIRGGTQQAFVNGVVHWIGYYPRMVGKFFLNSIVSFNLITESFGTMMVPDSVERHGIVSVAVVGESLSLIHTDFLTCCVWEMKEYGIVNSWTKKFEIELARDWNPFWGPFGFRRNGDVLMETINGDLVSCNPESNQVKHLGINGGDGRHFT